MHQLDTEISKLVRERSSSYVKEGESFLSGSVTEGGFIPRFMATNELELDEMNIIGHIQLSESQTFLESIDGYPGYFRLRSCDELYRCLTAIESTMFEWLGFKSGEYFGLPIGLMQLRKYDMCKRNSMKLDNKIEGPSLNTHSSVDMKSLQEALVTVQQRNKTYMETSSFPLPLAPSIRKVELPPKIQTS
eukprot:TCONS_00063958-protein